MVTRQEVGLELNELYRNKKLTYSEHQRLKRLFGIQSRRKNPYQWLSEPLDRLYHEGKISKDKYQNAKKIFQLEDETVSSEFKKEFCKKCGNEIPPETVYCPGCGSGKRINIYCSECGAKIPSEAIFCPECGTKQIKV